MKCVHTFGTGRHKRKADITLLFQYICPGSNIVCNDQLNRERVGVFFTFDVGHFISFKHGSCLGEFGCITTQQLFSLSNTVDVIKYHVNCIGEAE